MSQNPLISVITPAFNAESFIERAYRSLVDQTHTNWEWIVIDDKSVDHTHEILSKLKRKDKRLTIIKNTANVGVGLSRNVGLAAANGEFVAFLDADDQFVPDKLLRQSKFMNGDGDGVLKNISYTPFYKKKEGGEVLSKIIDKHAPQCITYNDLLLKRATFGCSTVMIRKLAVDFKFTDRRMGQDYVAWLSLLKNDIAAQKCNFVGTIYEVRHGSVSSNKIKKALDQWLIYRNTQHLNFYYSLIAWINYAVRSLIR